MKGIKISSAADGASAQKPQPAATAEAIGRERLALRERRLRSS
jgi:hypothetical protein